MQLNKHPVIRQVYELCQAIETFPASPEQTALIVKASDLGDEIEKFVDAKGLRCDYLPDATYFLDQDGDCHWFLVDASKRKEWQEWKDIPDGSFRGGLIPDFAREIGTHPNRVEFHVTDAYVLLETRPL